MAKVSRALITGGSRGIGYSIAEKLITEGVDVCISGRDPERLTEAKERIRLLQDDSEDRHGTIYSVTTDLIRPESPKELVSAAAERLGGIDLLVNNAGISLSSPLEETTIEEWDRILNINARAPYFICQYALPWLRKSSAPTIIQIASVVSHKGYELQSAYSASKHAMLGFTKAFAKEVQSDDIRIFTFSPGGVATDMVTSVRPDIDIEELIDPDELAELVWFVVTHRGNAMIDHFSIRRATKTAWI